MILQDIVDRISAQCPRFGGRVYLFTDITQLDDVDADVPAAFVLRTSDSAETAEGMGGVIRQERTRSVAVMVCDTAPTDTGEPLEDSRSEVFAALMGWGTTPEIQLEHAGGEAMPPVGGIHRWQDSYRYRDELRYPIP